MLVHKIIGCRTQGMAEERRREQKHKFRCPTPDRRQKLLGIVHDWDIVYDWFHGNLLLIYCTVENIRNGYVRITFVMISCIARLRTLNFVLLGSRPEYTLFCFLGRKAGGHEQVISGIFWYFWTLRKLWLSDCSSLLVVLKDSWPMLWCCIKAGIAGAIIWKLEIGKWKGEIRILV